MDSDDEDSPFISIGTPLPELLEDELPKKHTAYSNQAVKDARGRPQRLHGAFTGGFSAGFFNTVGSEKGFTPSTFVSSRNQKAESKNQSIADFMDDEDTSEHGIAPKKIQATEEFSRKTEDRKRKVNESSFTLENSQILDDIITPKRLVIGVKLMRKLGWKDGQGVGPRVMRKKKGPKVYGCEFPRTETKELDTGGSSSDDDDYASNLTFAPKDVTSISFQSKDDVHGIGYRGIDAQTALTGGHINLFDAEPVRQGKNKKGIQGQAFGVGALEEEDEDVYTVDDMSRYDFHTGGSEKDIYHGWTAPKNQDMMRKALGQLENLLEGFKMSDRPVPPKQIFPAPKIPRGYKPYHNFTSSPDNCFEVLERHSSEISVKTKSDISAPPTDTTRSEEKLDASKRSSLLGEKPDIRSVFDLIPERDKVRMEFLKPKTTVTKDYKDKSYKEKSKGRWDSKEPIRHSSSSSATSVESQRAAGVPLFAATSSADGKHEFKPFSRNPEKQLRYEMYLKCMKGGEKYPPDCFALTQGLTEWELERELEEFSRSAQLYKPMSSLMASRFTQAKHADSELNANVKLLTSEEATKPETDEEKAAKMKMFGRLTHQTIEWHPCNVLCKRFNVPNPYPDSSIVGLPNSSRRDKFSIFDILGSSQQEETKLPEVDKSSTQPELPSDGLKASSQKKRLPLLAIIDKVNLDTTDMTNLESEKSTSSVKEMTQVSKAETKINEKPSEAERPPMDIFSAIFNDTSDEDDDDDDDDDDNGDNVKDDVFENPKNVLLDGDKTSAPTEAQMINKEMSFGKSTETRQPSTDTEDQNSLNCNRTVVNSQDEPLTPPLEDDHNLEMFGPPLPPSFIDVGHAKESKETSKHKKHKKHKSKQKHHKSKKKKSKKKHKERKSSRQYSDDSSDEDNEEMDIDSKLLAKLHTLQR